jgi:hypothetical protein
MRHELRHFVERALLTHLVLWGWQAGWGLTPEPRRPGACDRRYTVVRGLQFELQGLVDGSRACSWVQVWLLVCNGPDCGGVARDSYDTLWTGPCCVWTSGARLRALRQHFQDWPFAESFAMGALQSTSMVGCIPLTGGQGVYEGSPTRRWWILGV